MLAIEVETLWRRDARGRLTVDERARRSAAPHLVIACGRDGRVVALGEGVPDTLAEALVELGESGPLPKDLTNPPEALAQCEGMLRDVLGDVVRMSGPGYLVPPGTRLACEASIVRAGDAIATQYRTPPEEANWPGDEWRELVDGTLGPFALAVVEDAVVAVCHAARWRDGSAEAGVWTHPAHRGRGYAAAVTAAWAAQVRESGRLPFYSTSAENQSSRRVAERLELRRIGWIWQLSPRE